MRRSAAAPLALLCFALACEAEIKQPRVAGDWWTIAGDPDLAQHNDPNQQPVDFAIWQAADGTWQLWSCIRNTRAGGKTRLFYRWEGGKALTNSNWKPMGVTMQAKAEYGETL